MYKWKEIEFLDPLYSKVKTNLSRNIIGGIAVTIDEGSRTRVID